MKEEHTNVEEYNGILIDYSRDSVIPEQGKALLMGKGFYKRDHEKSPQQSFARAATSYCFGDYEFAQRIYEYASKQWFTNASPVLSNAVDIQWPTFESDQFEEAGDWLEENVEPDGMPISCFLSFIGDNKFSLVETRKEAAWLSMMGGGVGVYAGNRSPDEKSTGVMAHLRGYDADTLAYKQTASRRGSMAAYLPVNHPEIMAFLEMRNPVGGDSNKKCFNLNNAVNIPDSFMEAVARNEDYELFDPKHGPTGRFLNAREVWEKIMEIRFETGEPYLLFIDNVNRQIPQWITRPLYHVSQSNLCVAPETVILTDEGHKVISELENESVRVWNGENFTETVVCKTGEGQKLVKVVTDSGFELECTPYHKFYVQEKYARSAVIEKRAHELKSGDKLIKLETPVVEGDKVLDKAYQNGFYSGDGCCVTGRARIYLYGEKKGLEHMFPEKSVYQDDPNSDRVSFYVDGLQHKFFVPDEGYTIESRINWLEGLLDADGCVARNGKSQTLQIASVQEGFLEAAQLMLQTLGVQSKIKLARVAGSYPLPANDGSGELKMYDCKHTDRLLISGMGIVKLMNLGFSPERLKLTDHMPNRDASGFVKVKEVVDEGRVDDTYCFTESERGMGVFNGILTGQCSEITLMTSETRTAVCCLSSLNLEKYDEWKDSNIVQDLVRYLDNVLEYFIRLAPPELNRAVHSARKERAIGLGTLGWHSFLQSKRIPFESGGLLGATHYTSMIYKAIKSKAVEESQRLAAERGEPSDCHGGGMRNSHLLAIAPNASSSNMVGASPSIEPWNANAFTAKGRAGSFLIKNKYLEEELEKIGLNDEDTWSSIITSEGSCQHIEELPENIREVFKTASEINPQWIVEQASVRQPEICQSQSLNVYVPNNMTKQAMSDLHFLGWAKNLKSFYYCRSKPATRANVGTGREKPLNSVDAPKIDMEGCVSCEG